MGTSVSKNKDALVPIYIRIRYGRGTDIVCQTGFQIKAVNWSNETQQSRRRADVFEFNTGGSQNMESGRLKFNDYQAFNTNAFRMGPGDMDNWDEIGNILRKSGSKKTGAFSFLIMDAKTDELVELCRDVAELNGVYSTHMRSEQDLVLEAIDEAIAISRESGVSLQISHVKANYKMNWSKISKILQKIEEAKDYGIPILADRYPYNASSTGLNSFFPLWAREGTNAVFVDRLKDKSLGIKLKAHIKEMEEKMETWNNVLLSSVLSDKNKHLKGKTVLKAAIEAKKAPYEFMSDLLIEEDGQVGMVKFGMSEDNLRQVLAHPLVVIGSDGNAVAPYGSLSKDKPHPRFYGTFPRVLGRYVRNEKILTLHEAVYKMTSLTAEKFGLSGRGRITEGSYADIVIFNPDTVIDRATYEDPHQYPEGIVYVIVNGHVVINNGEHTGKLPGKILRKEVV